MVIPQSSKLKPGVRFPCTAFLSVNDPGYISSSSFYFFLDFITFGLSKTLLKNINTGNSFEIITFLEGVG
jgi:hypothetical protein